MDGTLRYNTAVCTWIYGDPLADLAVRLHTLGFDGVELSHELDAYQARETREILAGQATRAAR